VLRETTSRGLRGLVCPSRTSERGGEGYCVKEGGGEEGERVKERAREVRLQGRCGGPSVHHLQRVYMCVINMTTTTPLRERILPLSSGKVDGDVTRFTHLVT
jgi:hypothetical protein